MKSILEQAYELFVKAYREAGGGIPYPDDLDNASIAFQHGFRVAADYLVNRDGGSLQATEKE